MKWAQVRRLELGSESGSGGLLGDLARELFAQQEELGHAVGDVVRQSVIDAVYDQRQSREFRKQANSFDALERARNDARRERDRPEPAGWGLAGVLAAYVGLTVGLSGHGAGLAPEIIVALSAACGARVGWRLRLRLRCRGDVATAASKWRDELRDNVLKAFLFERENERKGERLELEVTVAAILVASYGRDPEYVVSSAAMRSVAAAARTAASGSIGISGPRGAGKTTVLSKLDTRRDPGAAEQDLRVIVAAPVDYDAREFIIHLFTELCRKVLAEADPLSSIAIDTRLRLDELRYLDTMTGGWGSTLGPVGLLGLTGSLSRQKAEQPAGLPSVIERFRAYSARVADWNRSRPDRDEGRLLICIDEMDKISDSARAEQFLNEIKAIFGVPGCLFLVSISEDAMMVFTQRTPAIRTAFDSAFDAVVVVQPMIFVEAQHLLDLRVSGIPRPFLALCHVLAGGIPRELIRAARSLRQVAETLQGPAPGIAPVTTALVRDRCRDMRREAVLQLDRAGASARILLPLYRQHWPARDEGGPAPADLELAAKDLGDAAAAVGNDEWTRMCQDVAVALSFYATVIDLFGKAPDRVRKALQGEGAPPPGGGLPPPAEEFPLIDELAVVRHAMWTHTDLARELLVQYRKKHQIGDGDGGQ
jgi:hypothetical protein